MSRALLAEFFGTALLLLAVVGSGIMAERLAMGNVALALLANALATGAALAVLIAVLGPLSGAHFNPCVTLYFALTGGAPWHRALMYIPLQLAGAAAGVWIAHLMFALPVLELSRHVRSGWAEALGEFVATLGLLGTIVGAIRFGRDVALLVGLYIAGAYWFTASTAFANPAVTLARALTDSFAGIAPQSVPEFLLAQLLATAAAVWGLPKLFAAGGS